VRQRELSRSCKVIESLNDEQKKAVDIITRSIIKKILHNPIILLKKGSQEENNKMLLDAACYLFGVDGHQNIERKKDKDTFKVSQDKTVKKSSPVE
jgi:glutamyl-tRNA reductase